MYRGRKTIVVGDFEHRRRQHELRANDRGLAPINKPGSGTIGRTTGGVSFDRWATDADNLTGEQARTGMLGVSGKPLMPANAINAGLG